MVQGGIGNCWQEPKERRDEGGFVSNRKHITKNMGISSTPAGRAGTYVWNLSR